VLAAALGCAGAQAPHDVRTPAAAPAGGRCVADHLGPLGPGAKVGTSSCGSGPPCGEACLAGDAVACYRRGVEIQEQNGPPDAAEAMYLHACQGGLAIGCTNYAAGVGVHSDTDSACAKRLFEKACAVDEAFACGMFGRVLIEEATPAHTEQIERGRAILDQSCKKLGQFPCRVLALETELGHFGPPDVATVQELFARACATGDSDACGPPPSAKSTFHTTP